MGQRERIETRFDEAVMRSTYEEEYGPGAFEVVESGAARLCQMAVSRIAFGYEQACELVGRENAYNFMSRFLQLEGIKPPPRRRGKSAPGRATKPITAQDVNAAERKAQREKARVAAERAKIMETIDKMDPKREEVWGRRDDIC
jgi:hypothetical protein